MLNWKRYVKSNSLSLNTVENQIVYQNVSKYYAINQLCNFSWKRVSRYTFNFNKKIVHHVSHSHIEYIFCNICVVSSIRPALYVCGFRFALRVGRKFGRHTCAKYHSGHAGLKDYAREMAVRAVGVDIFKACIIARVPCRACACVEWMITARTHARMHAHAHARGIRL